MLAYSLAAQFLLTYCAQGEIAMRQRRGYFRRNRTTEIGKEMTNLRISQGLTQEEVARKLGWSKSYICKIERGPRTPSPNIVSAFALACRTRPEYLLGRIRQLQLNLLNAIMAPTELPLDSLKDVTEEERLELIRYLGFLRLRRPLDKLS